MDINTICAVGSLIFSLCTFFGGGIAFCILKFNDFKHLEKNYEKSEKQKEEFENKINEKLDKLLTLQTTNTTDIAIINERCNIHKTINKR